LVGPQGLIPSLKEIGDCFACFIALKQCLVAVCFIGSYTEIPHGNNRMDLCAALSSRSSPIDCSQRCRADCTVYGTRRQ
jgi:hypothetical protein